MRNEISDYLKSIQKIFKDNNNELYEKFIIDIMKIMKLLFKGDMFKSLDIEITSQVFESLINDFIDNDIYYINFMYLENDHRGYIEPYCYSKIYDEIEGRYFNMLRDLYDRCEAIENCTDTYIHFIGYLINRCKIILDTKNIDLSIKSDSDHEEIIAINILRLVYNKCITITERKKYNKYIIYGALSFLEEISLKTKYNNFNTLVKVCTDTLYNIPELYIPNEYFSLFHFGKFLVCKNIISKYRDKNISRYIFSNYKIKGGN